MEKNLKKINIPFFKEDKDVLKCIEEIRIDYTTEFEIIKSELSKHKESIIDNGIQKDVLYTSGVDIILERRKKGAEEPLIEKPKVKDDKNDNKSKDQKKKSFNELIEDIFPNIDYNYWMTMNPFYADAPLLPTMRICLINFASLPGLINDVIDNIENMTCKKLVSLIENDINEIIKNDLFEDQNKMLRVFDLINGWGGKMGKATYVKPKGNTTRNSSDKWYNHYVNGVKKAIKSENEGLADFIKIPNVGDSFGTKHLYFWSLYGSNMPIPIYDARIKTLLYLSVDEAPSFEQYVEDMSNFSTLKNITINQLEKALFAFSSNYFSNESLIIKKENLDKTDLDEAKRIENLYNSNNMA
jgi:hypothetical protein